MPNDDLDNLTQEAYDAWAVDEPPAGFADRVLSELDRQEAGPPPLVEVADLSAGERSTAWPWRLRGLLVGMNMHLPLPARRKLDLNLLQSQPFRFGNS